MADYNAIRKKYEDDENLNKALDSKIQTNNTLFENKKATISDTYSKQIEDSKLEYEDAYRENAVQKKVNEFYIKENMANMGLSDSGLSRSQITANQISYANQKADIDRQRQSMVEGLTTEMLSLLSNAENERMSAEQSIRAEDEAYRTNLAMSQYETDTANETAIETARIEGENEIKKKQAEYENEKILKQMEYDNEKEIAKMKSDYAFDEAVALKEVDRIYDSIDDEKESEEKAIQQQEEDAEELKKNKASDYKNLYTHLKENDDDDYDYSARAIDTYLQKYDIEFDTAAGRTELNALLKAAGITYEQFEYYLDNGTIYVPASKYDSKNPKGITKFNYKTDGKANYIIKVTKSTRNGGGKNTVDNNDEVEIYYADGKTPVGDGGTIKLGDLSKTIGLALTAVTAKVTKKDINNGKNVLRIKNIDLSGEDLG